MPYDSVNSDMRSLDQAIHQSCSGLHRKSTHPQALLFAPDLTSLAARTWKKIGINGTPAFVVNGYYSSGAQTEAAFRKLVELPLKGALRVLR